MMMVETPGILGAPGGLYARTSSSTCSTSCTLPVPLFPPEDVVSVNEFLPQKCPAGAEVRAASCPGRVEHVVPRVEWSPPEWELADRYAALDPEGIFFEDAMGLAAIRETLGFEVEKEEWEVGGDMVGEF